MKIMADLHYLDENVLFEILSIIVELGGTVTIEVFTYEAWEK